MDYCLDLDPENVCRICLQTSDKLVSIYTKQIINGEIKTMPEIIQSCFNIDIPRKITLPHKICKLCKSTVISFFQFKEKFVRSETVLHEIFLSTTDSSNNKIKNEEEIYQVLENEFEENATIEEIFRTKITFIHKNVDEQNEENDNGGLNDFNQIEELSQSQTDGEIIDEQFIERDIQVNETELPFELCEENTQNNDDSQSVSQITAISQSKQKESSFCKICNKRIRSDFIEHEKLHESLHLLSESSIVFICNNCSKAYIQSSDPMEEKENCPQCANKETNDEFTDIQFLEDDNNETLECGVCNFSYENCQDLKCHMMIHLSRFDCPFQGCGYQYENFHYFSNHIKRKHLTATTHICKYCKQENIKDYDALKKHYLICSARKLKCYQCEKSFCSEKTLQSHIRLRHMSRKFVCEVCGKSFTQASELNIHNRIHTGDRPFSCTICGNQFKTASVRASHMETHSEAKFPCPLCNIVLGSKRILKLHIKRHTQEKKKKCSFCGKTFFTNWHLKTHHSKKHKNFEFENE